MSANQTEVCDAGSPTGPLERGLDLAAAALLVLVGGAAVGSEHAALLVPQRPHSLTTREWSGTPRASPFFR